MEQCPKEIKHFCVLGTENNSDDFNEKFATYVKGNIVELITLFDDSIKEIPSILKLIKLSIMYHEENEQKATVQCLL